MSAPMMPVESFPAPPVGPPIQQWPAQVRTAPPQAAPPSRTWVQQAPAAPKFRAQMEDEPNRPVRQAPSKPAPALLTMPSPEALGVPTTNLVGKGGPDWTALHRRLDQLAVHATHLEKCQGGYRFVCLIPTGQPDRFRRFESQAGTDTEAVRLALEEAEKWAGGK